MSRFRITELPFGGLKIIERHQIGDSRGFLSRIFCADELASAGWKKPLAQINHTYTAIQGIVRGMHFQLPPNTEMKLVTCIQGKIWDVAIDIRANSPNFLKWHAEILSAENCRAMLIPQGFAHGYQTLTNDVELIYCHSEFYRPEVEGGLHPKDPAISISWPLPIIELSKRDASHDFINHEFKGIVF